MKIGSLIKIQHFQERFNGKLGIVVRIVEHAGWVETYSIRVPSYDFEIGLAKEQCGVICEGR
jgi:hypothetical protein